MVKISKEEYRRRAKKAAETRRRNTAKNRKFKKTKILTKDEKEKWQEAGFLSWLTRRRNVLGRELYNKIYRDLDSKQQKNVNEKLEKQFTESYRPARRKDKPVRKKEFWLNASSKAEITWLLAISATKWMIKKVSSKPKWQLVTFTGPHGRESSGIVDILAIRKNHKIIKSNLSRGDPFEMILIQVKGGSAKLPTENEIMRLQRVAVAYDAKDVVLSEWKHGELVNFYRLNDKGNSKLGNNWEKSSPEEIFG